MTVQDIKREEGIVAQEGVVRVESAVTVQLRFSNSRGCSGALSMRSVLV